MRISMAVNDRNGSNTTRIRRIDFDFDGDTGIELECIDIARWKRDRENKRVIIDGKEYPYMSYGTWAGNMSWDAMGVSEETALRLVEDCRASGKWSISAGYAFITEAWDEGKPITFDEPQNQD